MITRKQYMDKEFSHHEYYSDIAKEAGVKSFSSQAFLDMCKHELENGNEHLNPSTCTPQGSKCDLALLRWDSRGAKINTPLTSRAFRDRGDYATLAGLVSLIKTVVRNECESL